MKKEELQGANIKKKKVRKVISISRFFLYGIIGVFLLFLSVPSLKTYASKKVAQYFTFQGKEVLSFDKIEFNWFDVLEVKDLRVKDTNDSTILSARRAIIDISLIDLLFNNETIIDQLTLDSLDLNISKDHADSLFNVSSFVRTYFRKKNKKSKPIYINELILNRSSIKLRNKSGRTRDKGLDPNNLDVRNISAKVNYVFLSDSVYADINQLSFKEARSGLQVKEFETNFILTKQKMNFDNLLLKTRRSIIKDTVRLEYKHLSALKHIYDSVKFDFRLNNNQVVTEDLEKILGTSIDVKDRHAVSLFAKGRLSNLNIDRVNISFGDDSYINSKVFLNGLPDLTETFFDIRFTNSNIVPRDLAPYLKKEINDKFNQLGAFSYKGSLTGFLNDFVTKGKTLLDAGAIHTDIKISLNQHDIEKTTYSGSIVFDSLDVSSFSSQNFIKKISLQGKIKGSGISRKTASIDLDGNISSLETKYYNITNIVTDGTFALNYFDGRYAIKDPKLKLFGTAKIDFTKGKQNIDFEASIDTLYAQELLNLKNEYFTSSNITLKIANSQDGDIKGAMVIDDLMITNFKDSVFSESTLITSRTTDKRIIEIENNDFQVILDGAFDLKTISRAFPSFIKEVRLALVHKEKEIETYYGKKRIYNKDFFLNYLIKINNISDWLKVLYPKIEVSDNWDIVGTFNQEKRFSTFTSTAKPNLLKINDRLITKPSIDLNFGKPVDLSLVIGNVLVEADSLNLNISKPRLFMNWEGNNIEVNAYGEQTSSSSIIDIYSHLKINEESDTILYSLQPASRIYLLDEYWFPSEENSLYLAPGFLELNDFIFKNGLQTVSVQGVLSNKADQELNIKFDQLDLNTFSLLSNQKLEGVSTGEIKLKILNENLLAETNLQIKGLKAGSTSIGNITSRSNWFTETKSMAVDLFIEKEEKKYLSLKGNIYPYKKEPLKLNAKLDNLDISLLQGLFSKHLSKLSGNANGTIAITGEISSPTLKGPVSVSNGSTHLKYFNTDYDFDGKLLFDEDKIALDSVVIVDNYLDVATASGTIFHSNFRDVIVDIRGTSDKFQIVNTTYSDNQIYYGNIFASGKIHFVGPLRNLVIDAKMTTEKGTKLYIPIDDGNSGTKEEFISFIDLTDSTNTVIEIVDSVNSNIKGIKMSLAVEVTPDAYGEIIFDIKSGDIIRGNGVGNLNLNLDTRGEFSMFGDLNIEKGGYNFTLQNVINKEFDIKQGSKISWHGDPYKAILDINASYRQLTSLSSLITDLDQEEVNTFPELNTKYPAYVNLNITEQMLSPRIKFDIDIEDYPENAIINGKTLETYINIFQNNLLSDEQELNRQVFSLIILKKLAQQQNLSFEGTINNSVSELISNQISYWINQIDENLEIDVDLNSLDADALNTLQLRLAYTLLDGRLKISRDGNLTDSNNFIENQEETSADLSTLIGNIAIEYLLTKDGKLRAKMYSRQSTNSYLSDINQRNETGFSLKFTKSFNKFFVFIDDLIKKKRKEEENN